MNDLQRQSELNRIFGFLIEELDVPPSKYEDAKNHYDAVGSWLNDEGSPLAAFNPTIYPQGSFALGTVIKPIGDDDYDVDAVCQLKLSERQTTQKGLKNAVGARLKQHKAYVGMLEPEGRRCWTLKYADESQFHLDILPCIPDDYQWLLALGIPEDIAKHAICITDKETWDTDPQWPRSNPKGYLTWFKSRMRVRFDEARSRIAMEKKAEVEQVPEYEVRTPLQRAVQILKRHRDLKYNGDDDKPISIIITTLAAHAYNNEADLFDALRNMLPKMRSAIELRGTVYWVANPVNPKENFADKWEKTPRKRQLFFEWITSLDVLYQELLNADSMTKVGSILNESFGERETSSVMRKFASESRGSATPGPTNNSLARLVPSASNSVSRFAVPHRQPPRWPVRRTPHQVSIRGYAEKRDGFRPFHYEYRNDGEALPKEATLKFHASTDVPRPYDVFWQVVNTGEEARIFNNLRGDFYADGLIRTESSYYSGMHWVECFIVKDGACVARSGEFVVNIQ